MKIVILAGGEGKRLRPYTYVLPKPLLPIGDKPILDITLEKLKTQGIKDIILAVNYKAGLFDIIYGDGSSRGMNISYLRESQPLGTAGPLRSLKDKIFDDFFVMNGDIICDLNLEDLKKTHREAEADITVVTRKIETPINFGVLQIENEKIVGWDEKPKIKSEISAGMYMLKPSVLDLIPKNEFYDMNDLVKRIILNGGKVLRFLYGGDLLDVGNREDYRKAQNNFEEKKDLKI